MKKKLFAILWLWMLFSLMLSPVTFADDDFWDFSTNVSWWGWYETTQEDAQLAANSFLQKMDFFWWSLLANAIRYWYYYPNCFTSKIEKGKDILYARPATCWPRWSKLWSDQKPIRINWDLKIQDLMDWKYSLTNSFLLVLIPLLFSVWILSYIFFMSYWWSDWWSSAPSSWWIWMWWGMWWMWWWAPSSSWSSMVSWTVWWWIIEKLFWKFNKKDWEDEKDQLSTKLFAILFLVFLLWAWNLLSISLSSTIPIYFDQWFKWLWALYWVWWLYLLSYWLFLWIIFVLIKYPLLKFIQMDVEKKENVSVPIETFKVFGIAIVLLWVTSVIISNFLVQLVSIIIKA